jgi:hypothetical protein
MPAPRKPPRFSARAAIQVLLIGLLAGMATVPFCLGLGDLVEDMVLSKLESSLASLDGKQDKTVLEAVFLQNECSDGLLECQKPQALSDLTDLRCFTICIAVETGCRSCCSGGTCYQPAGNGQSLGTCGPCQDTEAAQQYALVVC